MRGLKIPRLQMKWLSQSIKTYVMIGLIGIISLFMAVQVFYSITQFKSSMESKVQDNLKAQAGEITNKLNIRFSEIGKHAELLAYTIEAMPRYDSELLLNVIEKYITSDNLVVGGGFWFEPNAYQPNVKYYGPYKYKGDQGKITLTWEYSNADYDYFKYDWYKAGLVTKDKVVWSEPYEDAVTNVAMVTSTSPIRKNSSVIGVTTFDIGLKEFEEYIRAIKVGNSGYAFIITQEGRYLGHRNADKNLKIKITEEQDDKLRQLGNQIIHSTTMNLIETKGFGSDDFVVSAPIGDTGMKLVLVYPMQEAYQEVRHVLAMNIGIFLALVILLSFIIIKGFNTRIGRPLDQLVQDADQIARGNLSLKVKVTANDEIGRLANSFNGMAEHLRNVIEQVLQLAEYVAASAQQLTANAEQSAHATHEVAQAINAVSGGTQQQVSQIADTTARVEQVAEGVQQVALNADSAALTSGRAANTAQTGQKSVEEAIKQMLTLEATIANSAQVVAMLGERSNEIGQIVDTISGIAGQTNLLALNAAIEAARAGEQGRGFAVVAEEVRKLAEQSQTAAKQIALLIQEIQSETNRAVQAMEAGTSEVKLGAKVVNHAGEAFSEIVQLIDQVAEQVKDIFNASQQMAGKSKQVVNLVGSIDEISKANSSQAQNVSAATEEQAASMIEIAQSSEDLAQRAQELRNLVGKFKI
ncbi:methyl-accepting chemotaxis protein [Sporomusaceae bacterium FL31]|nr:methyl-accepting chemotaxis protein [Sporomusaceae bacterium FL31]GCE32975.1 methyl-accepting chemotaxis protein [Sporomusaceae bacterium]